MAAGEGSETSVYAPVVLSDALADQVKELLTAGADAAQAIRDSAQADASAVPELEATVSELRGLVADLRADVDRLTAELTLVGGEQRLLPPPRNASTNGTGFDRRALLIAVNMASNGASRAEAAAYLAENLELHDCGELLDAVYGYVDSTAA